MPMNFGSVDLGLACDELVLSELSRLAQRNGCDVVCTPARLAVLPNPWFGVTAAREVTVVWHYLGFVAAWAALFDNNPPVQAIIERPSRTWGENRSERALSSRAARFPAASASRHST